MLKQRLKKIFYVTASSALVWAGFIAIPAQAANFSAEKIISSDSKTNVKPLEVYNYRVGFKNTGTEVWNATGANKVTVKTTENVVYEHWFYSRSWQDKITVAAVHRDGIKTDEIGFFNLQLEAPTKPGSYNNRFALFVGDKKIAGTDFSVPLIVGGISTPVVTTNATHETIGTANTAATTPTANTVAAPTASDGVSGQVIINSGSEINVQPGAVFSYKVGIKNTGLRNWRNSDPSWVVLELDANTMSPTLNDGSWRNDTIVQVINTDKVENGQLAFFRFTMKAPNTNGVYNPKFRLIMNGDTLVSGTDFSFKLTVGSNNTATTPPANNQISTGNSVVCIAAQEPGSSTEAGACNPPHNEPRLRVGIDKLTDNQLGVTADTDFVIKDVAGTIFRTVSPGQVVFLSYDKTDNQYVAAGAGPPIRTPYAIKVEAVAEPSIITLTTFKNPVAYNPGWNDNVYRGAIELHWSENDEAVWIINELLMEDYLKGLAEFSNSAPAEYQKSLIVAARTYAMYHMQTGTKHAKRYFHVAASVSDQYYRGYESEKRMPTIVNAVESTRGQMVTYNGEVVVTPYSANTSGVSRTWSEVWGGSDKPWLIKQTIPYDVGRTRFGHGVGLSQLAAADMARAGLGYVDILKFFYVGTEVSQWYN